MNNQINTPTLSMLALVGERTEKHARRSKSSPSACAYQIDARRFAMALSQAAAFMILELIRSIQIECLEQPPKPRNRYDPIPPLPVAWKAKAADVRLGIEQRIEAKHLRQL